MIEHASHVVLPGVGSFGATMAGLREAGLDVALAARVGAGRATLAMCVGLQVLFERSDESPNASGLGRAPRPRRSLSRSGARAAVWLEPGRARARLPLLEPGYAYFANSYRVQDAPGCRVATAEHGGRFVAALEQGRVLAFQFHPELSARTVRR